NLTARSPLQRYDDVEKELREKWEDELTAAIEAEYRRQRGDLLVILQRWLRDVWLQTMSEAGSQRSEARGDVSSGLLNFPEIDGTKQVARRISPNEALENLQILETTQRLLHTNVQE